MHSEKGSVLAITTGFVLAFTMFGVGAIYFSGVQSQDIEKKVSSTKAFWLAEAGVEKAFVKMPGVLYSSGNDESLSFGLGTYNVNTALKSGYMHRWTIDSTGFTTPSTRRIHVEVGPNITTIFKSTGPLDFVHGTPNITGPTEEKMKFSFEDIFGISEATMRSLATHYLVDPQPNPDNVSGITWVDVSHGSMKISSNVWGGSGILIVNGDLDISGGTFSGVIWVNGRLDIGSGNPQINGSIFEYDVSNTSTKITGSGTFTFDPLAIDNAFSYLLGYDSAFHNIISWQEVD